MVKCKCGAEMTCHGFDNYNKRWECSQCNRVKIPASSVGRTSNWFFPEWTTKEEYVHPGFFKKKTTKKKIDLKK